MRGSTTKNISAPSHAYGKARAPCLSRMRRNANHAKPPPVMQPWKEILICFRPRCFSPRFLSRRRNAEKEIFLLNPSTNGQIR
ncbi:hypothetical protein CEXT_27221 [Caerostris extrusa]|uniref:Uncharacterized protein n=1 Tax=Caerostris extrusa TaxID=172846 RepID=A0AAV4QU69_CAEEX|nr:hypothetical protein CEXT_27221 [Caerostris extrusa]